MSLIESANEMSSFQAGMDATPVETLQSAQDAAVPTGELTAMSLSEPSNVTSSSHSEMAAKPAEKFQRAQDATALKVECERLPAMGLIHTYLTERVPEFCTLTAVRQKARHLFHPSNTRSDANVYVGLG